MIEAGDGAESRAPRPMTEGRRNPAGRQEGSDSKTAGGSVETQTDVRQLTVTYRPDLPRGSALVSLPISPGTYLVRTMRPAAPFERYFGGGGVVCRTV